MSALMRIETTRHGVVASLSVRHSRFVSTHCARARKPARTRPRMRGAALVVTLMLLIILTLLASTGLRMSVGELWMAGNEQYHRRAIDAASAGIEIGVARVGAIGMAAATDADGDRLIVQDGAPETSTVVIRPAGYESTLPGSSVGKLAGEHFEIESTGGSLREARDVQVQGVMVVSASGGEARFTRIADGLEGEEP